MSVSITVPYIYTEEFLKFIKDAQTSQYTIWIESDYSSVVYPYIGKFSYVHEGDTFEIDYHNVGTPKSVSGEFKYYSSVSVTHEGGDLKKLEKFVTDAITKTMRAKKDDRVQLFTSTTYGYFTKYNDIVAQNINCIFLPEQIKSDIRSVIDKFIESKDRYQKFGRVYKTSFMFVGVPGSGKTSLVKSLALEYDRPLYIISFTKEMTDQKLVDLVKDIKKDSILLIEDLDSLFVDKQPQNINVSFSTLLNFLDGVHCKGDGLITFITANNPDRFDTALIRPGRIDKIVKFESPKRPEIEAAFIEMTNGHKKFSQFQQFYDCVKHTGVSMSGIVDYLFRHPDDYMESIDQLLDHTRFVNEITSDKVEKMYA